MAFQSASNALSTTREIIATGKNPGETGVLVYNADGAITVYVGDSTVDATEGVPIVAGGSYSIDLHNAETLWAVAASGTPTVVVQINNQ